MSASETLPQLNIEVAGVTLDDTSALSLTEVRILQRLSLPSLCELVFQVPGTAIANVEIMSIGTPIRVVVNAGEVLFDGEVTALHHAHSPACGHEVRVRGYDKLHRLRKHQQVRAFSDKRLPELARELLADLSLEIAIDDAGPVWPRIVQWHQSDLELLTEISNRCGQYFTLSDGVVKFVSLEGSEAVTPLVLGESLLEIEIDANTESACRQLDIHAWDPWHAEPCDGSATQARSGRDIQLDVDHASVGSDALCTFADEAFQSGAQASCLAQAELDRRVGSEVVCKGVATGNAELRPGSRVNLAGVGETFRGNYVVTAVTHSIDRESGFRSAFDTRPPATTAKREQGSICTLGHVLDADDPSGLGRVKVSLPTFAGIESDWLGVLTPGAGNGKGLICIPDKGDRVLVLMPRSDPAQGIVLGGLYGTESPPDSGVEDGRVQRFTFMTPGGQRLCLDDEQKSVCVETRAGDALVLRPGYSRLSDKRGNYVEMNREHVRVHSSADLELEAPGNTVLIRGARIDFETA
ncbi:MAG: phage baseplate assembly protein V [Gammaproteobacteria bacterium]|nr:phage baseplate assembly protein V [Gammaproteobacteria bacterium]